MNKNEIDYKVCYKNDAPHQIQRQRLQLLFNLDP